MRTTSTIFFSSLLAMTASTVAVADDKPPADGSVPSDGTAGTDGPQTTPGSDAAPTPSSDLPAAKSDNDVQPEVASPGMPAGGIVSQAGVGGVVGYGRAGVLELGGAAGLTLAQDIRAVNFSPSIGWFLVDNFELSAVLDVTNLKAGTESATLWSALAEPSFHLPFNRSMFGMIGMGVGAAYVSQLGTGLAVAPRIGMDFLVGRSGILRPSLSYEYTTHDAMGSLDSNGNADVTLVAISSALRFNIRYSTMW
jgi:hypothetical protein